MIYEVYRFADVERGYGHVGTVGFFEADDELDAAGKFDRMYGHNINLGYRLINRLMALERRKVLEDEIFDREAALRTLLEII